jgi:flagellar basal-body rod protein FlgB
MIQEGMDLAMARRRLIASNLANAETPGYKAVDVDFERYLREAQGPAGSVAQEGMILTHAKHMRPIAMDPHLPLRWTMEISGGLRADQNTVDMEREMGKMAQNQIRFQALTEALNRMFALLQEAATEGGRR